MDKMKAKLTLYSILLFWVLILIGVIEFHIGIPIRILFLMAFLCVGWLAWWSVTTIRQTLLENKEEAYLKSKTQVKQSDQTNKNYATN